MEQEKKMLDVNKLVTVRSYARMRDVAVETIRLWIRQDKIHWIKIDGVYFVVLD